METESNSLIAFSKIKINNALNFRNGVFLEY